MSHAVCSIVPPHLLRRMLTHADLAPLALHTLTMTARLLGMRDLVAQVNNLPELAPGREYRQVFDCGHTERLPGRLVASEGQGRVPPGAAQEAYAYADATYQLFSQAFGRNSIDGNGMRLINSIGFSRLFDNAFWNGRQMVYGDGDGVVFNRFTAAADVVGHELTHGVTQYTARLNYHDQPGALNESISDCFGSMVKQFLHRQTADQADWLIGAGLFTQNVQGRALRDMLHPGTAYADPRLGTDPQPADMAGYVQTGEDEGGVHVNSGIPNRAFALAATQLGGQSWAGAGKVWYDALLRVNNPEAQFVDWARQTLLSAARVFGPQSKEYQAVQGAWQEVKVL